MPANTEQFSINALSVRLGFDRRTLGKWLRDVPPAGHVDGHPVYAIADVEAAIARGQQTGRRASIAKERLTALQADKLAFQIGVLKKEYVASADVEAEVGQMIERAKSVLYTGPTSLAPQVVGVSIAEAEALILEWVNAALAELCEDPLGTAAARAAAVPMETQPANPPIELPAPV